MQILKMNQKGKKMNNKQATLMESLKLMDNSFHFREGIIKFSKHETFKHFLAKCLMCYELRQNNTWFYTEAIFKGKGLRADIFVPSWNQAIEIVSSETKNSIEKKKEDYPVNVKFMKDDDVIKENLKWLKN